jgi:NAD-dependent SIR2 family protein deacetylase
MSEKDNSYAEVWHWQCQTCGLISGQWCSEDDPPENAPRCCAGGQMVKTMVRIKKEEPWP